MRLKEESNNWRAGGIIKRDFRHDASKPERMMLRGKKDTRRWCKGHVGREHQLIREQKGHYYRYIIIKCTVCKKEFYGSRTRQDLLLKLSVNFIHSYDKVIVRTSLLKTT